MRKPKRILKKNQCYNLFIKKKFNLKGRIFNAACNLASLNFNLLNSDIFSDLNFMLISKKGGLQEPKLGCDIVFSDAKYNPSNKFVVGFDSANGLDYPCFTVTKVEDVNGVRHFSYKSKNKCENITETIIIDKEYEQKD